MAVVDPVVLAKRVAEDSAGDAALRLEGLEAGREVLRLGPLVVHRRVPAFAVGVDGEPRALANTTWIRLVEAEDAVAAILHVADDPEDPDRAEEHVVGWVPAVERERLERWTAAMNGHIAELLHSREPPPPFPDPSTFPSLPGAGRIR